MLQDNFFTKWNYLWAGGFPLVANPHSDMYYLFSSSFYLVSQNLFIVNFIILAHVIIAYFAFYKLGSLITKNDNLLLIFSLFFAFSGVILGRIYAGHHLLVYGLAWTPLIYYYFLKITFFSESTVKNAVLLSIVSALMYFTGDIYHFVLVYLIIFLFFLYFLLTRSITRQTFYLLVLSVVLSVLVISIKNIPDLGIADLLVRNYLLNPFAGGGSFENNLASFVFGARIDSLFASYESAALIGIIPVLFMVIALIFGKKELVVPSFCAIIFAFIWADGGDSALSFIHLFPGLNTFRCPGRIFGVLLPLILFFSLYGTYLLFQKVKEGGILEVTPERKRWIVTGAVVCIIVKILELPYKQTFSFEAWASVLLIVTFILLLYFKKGTNKNIFFFFGISFTINCAAILWNQPLLPSWLAATQIFLVALLLCSVFIFIYFKSGLDQYSSICCGVLIAAVFLMILGNISYVTYFNPSFEKSPSIQIIDELKKNPSFNQHVWIYETGEPYKTIDFTYWELKSGLGSFAPYAAYYLRTMPNLTYTIGDVTYYTVDYLIDTNFLGNKPQALSSYSFKVNEFLIYKPEHVLPNMFLVRDNQLYPVNIVKFTPDEVISSGDFRPGDIVVLKTTYYPGWKVNGKDAILINNLVGTEITTNIKQVIFTFDPLDYKIGIVLTSIGLLLAAFLFIKGDTFRFFSVNKDDSKVYKVKMKKKPKS
jgi:hypothetical protein